MGRELECTLFVILCTRECRELHFIVHVFLLPRALLCCGWFGVTWGSAVCDLLSLHGKWLYCTHTAWSSSGVALVVPAYEAYDRVCSSRCEGCALVLAAFWCITIWNPSCRQLIAFVTVLARITPAHSIVFHHHQNEASSNSN